MGLDLVEMIMSVEEHFGVSIPDAEASKLRTTRDIVDYLSGQLIDRESHTSWTRDQLRNEVRTIVMRALGLETLSDDARFIEDLGTS